MDDTRQQSHFHSLMQPAKLAPLTVFLLIALFFYPSIHQLYERWIKWDEGLSHGLMIIAFLLFSAIKTAPWQQHTQSRFVTLSLTLGLAGISAFWFLTQLINIQILAQLAIIPALFLLTAVGFGWRVALQQKMLLAMPIFAIPVWEIFIEGLINLSSTIVGKLVQVIDMPAMIDGNSIFIPYGHILIADGCSGIRYFVIALALGYIISYLNHYNTKKIVITLAIAALLGLLANWVRIFALVIIGYETQMQSSLMSDHEYFGWAIFAAIGLPAIYWAPVIHRPDTTPNNNNLQLHIGRWCLAIAALSLGPLLNLSFNSTPIPITLQDQLSHRFIPVPPQRMPIPLSPPTPAHSEHARIGDVYVKLDQYQRLNATDKLVPYLPRLYDNQSWSVLTQETLNLDNTTLGLSKFRHKNSGQHALQLQCFTLGDYTTDKVAVAKLLQIPAQLRGVNHFRIISLQISCVTHHCDTERQTLIAAAHTLLHDLKGN